MHTDPEVLALLALGESVGTPADQHHVLACEHCRSELAQFERLTEVGRSTSTDDVMEAPGPHVWQRIRQELKFTGPLSSSVGQPQGLGSGPGWVAEIPASPAQPVLGTPGSDVPPPRSRSGRVLSLALAAVLALIAGVAIGLGINRFSQPTETVIGRAQLAPLPSWTGSSGLATVEVDRQGNRTLVVRLSAGKPVSGNRQVWLINASVTGMQSVGFLTRNEEGFPIPANLDLREFPIVDISEEPVNDPNSAHSGNSIVRGKLDL